MNVKNTVKVWDPLVRIFHWSIVLFFALAYVTGEEESQLHIISGYAVIGLVLFRIAWGFLGTRHARFTDFVVGPRKVLIYARSLVRGSPTNYLGHNPLGGWMIVALLASLMATGWTGLRLQEAEEAEHQAVTLALPIVASAVADEDDDENGWEEHEGHSANEEAEEFWEELHESAANLTLFLVFLHILGVVVASRLHRESLVKAMVTGKKSRD